MSLLASSNSASGASGSPRKWGRWLLGFGLLLAALLIAGLLLLDPWLRGWLERKATAKTQGRYQLRIGGLRTSLWQRAIYLRDVRLRPVKDERQWSDTTRLPRLLADVAQVRVTGVGLWAAVRGQVVPVDTVLLAGVRLRVLHLPAAAANARPWHERLPGNIDGLHVGYAGLRNLRAAYGPDRQPQASLRRADFTVQDLLLSAAGAADTQRLGYARAVQLRVAGVAARRVLDHEVTLAHGLLTSAGGLLTLESLRIRSLKPHGTREQQPKLTLTLAKLQLTAQSGFSSLRRHSLALDSLRLTAPRLTFTPPQQPPPPVYKLLAPYLRRLTLRHAALTGGYAHIAGMPAAPTIRRVSLTANNVRIDRQAASDPARVLYATSWQGHTGLATARISPPVYRGGYQSLDFDTKAGTVQVREVVVLPTMSATAVNRYKHHQSPNITARIPRLQLTGFDFPALDLHGSLLARQVTVSSPQVIIDGDGNFPLNPNPSIVTPERLGTLPLRLNVRRLRIAGARVRTNYLSPSSGRWGTLAFDRLNGTLTNLTNDPHLMSRAHPAVAQASGYVAGQWRADLKIWLPLLDPNGAHWGTATFGPGSITVLNSMTEPSRNVRFASGNVRKATMQFQANRQQITGTMRAEYSDLKLTLLSKKGGADHKTVFTKIGSSLLNGIVIRDENPRHDGGDLKVGSMASTRELRVSVFSLWRQGLVSGLLNSVGAPKPLAKKISEQQ